MNPCVVLACFLPSPDKAYVVAEIFDAVASSLDSPTVYVGIQHGSHADAEQIIRSAASGCVTHMERVSEGMHVDSDAAAFVEGLRLLRDSGEEHSSCYFIHTKGITSHNDDLRRQLLGDLLNVERTTQALSPRGVGSYGPHLTITRSKEDRSLMEHWIDRFGPASWTPCLPYFYAHTIWVSKGHCVQHFLDVVDPTFFTTPVPEFSDRYFAERDLPHLVDMLSGLRPSFGRLVGNHSTQYQRTRKREFLRELFVWRARKVARRARRLSPASQRWRLLRPR